MDLQRLELLKSAVGKPEEEVRKLLQVRGNVYRHEINAVMLRLWSTSEAFNDGVMDFLHDRFNTWKYCKVSAYADYINYHTGKDTIELAIAIHGKAAILQSI